jgi:hypothetical protein
MSNRFACLTVEGSLIGADLIDQIADGKAQGQKPADFNLDTRHLTDEIAAAWTEARVFWSSFQRQLARPNKNETSLTRDQWLIPLLGLLGYEVSYSSKAAEVDGATYAISHRAGADENAPPLHLVGWQQALDRRAESGRPRLSPHALMQEYLNRTESLWGLIANGHSLRLLRDSQLIRRQSYIEFDLRQMMEAEKFADFALLFRLLHRTRLPRGSNDNKDCLLEQYHQQTIEQGGRVRERLREGVEQAIKQFANALLRHPKNEPLRAQLDAGRFNAEDFYQQLLRLIYRLLFLMVAEERDLLVADASVGGRVYRDNYSVERLRRLLHVRAAANDHEDLWIGLQSLFNIFQDERLAEVLNVSPLNGDLFDTSLTPLLADTRLRNRDLLIALEPLALYRPTAHAPMQRINYRDLNVEELGSVYESLLDFHPVITLEYGRRIFNLVSGTERKSTGSYYTPPELVNELIESALVPVIKDRLSKAATKDARAQAILNIKVCDPACGSGHFLLAAARRLGLELARIRSGEQEPTPEERREATRDVIGECIYGVDKNPLAVDLCKVALWIEGNSRGKPLKFIDHRIRLGDSLVGVFDLSVLTEGIPDEAFEPMGGDDKLTARSLKSRNRDERERNESEQRLPFDPEAELHARADERREMLRIRDDSVAEANRKKALFRRLRESEACCVEQMACNLWTGAFFVDLTAENAAQNRVPTTEALNDYLTNHKVIDARLVSLTEPLAGRLRFFHWPLEFPEVFEVGGFDVVLGNPPWERIKLQEQEFFAERDLEIASAPNKAARGRLIATLGERRPELWQEYRKAAHNAEATSKFMRHGGRFPLTARGDINTYAIFAEQDRKLLNPLGRAGLILPTGIATDDTTKAFFGNLVEGENLQRLIGYENEAFIFPAVHHFTKFCALTIGGEEVKADRAIFTFNCRRFDHVQQEQRRFELAKEDLYCLNPNTRTCPIFRTSADAELTRKIYERVPVLVNEQAGENHWGVRFSTMFHMSNDSGLFLTREQMEQEGFALRGNHFGKGEEIYLPLYEAKMVWHFDHRYGSYASFDERTIIQLPTPTTDQYSNPAHVALPWYWVSFQNMMLRSACVPEDLLKAYKQYNEDKLIEALVAWAAGWHFNRNGERMRQVREFNPFADAADQRFKDAFTRFALRPAVAEVEAEYPLGRSDIEQLCLMAQQGSDARAMAETLMRLKTPRWFIGFRDITNATNERTAIFSLLPQVGVGHTMPLLSVDPCAPITSRACLLSNLNSLVFDYCTRQKIGGTHLTYSFLKQLPVLAPSAYTPADIAFIAPRVLELVYTSHDLKAFAEDCGYTGAPFRWDEERRASLRAELDAYFARLYGLTRDELRYILDPKEVYGADFPSETFRVLKEKEEARYGEYRTRRLVLEAWDRTTSH